MRTLYLLIIVILSTNCTHRVVRMGYQKSEPVPRDCEAVISRQDPITEFSGDKVGQVKLGLGVFTWSCNEKDALETLREEACAQNAGLIQITYEKRPSMWNACYKCKAELYRNSSVAFSPDGAYYSPGAIQTRVKEDSKKLRANTTVGIVTGAFLGGIVGFLSTF